MDSDTQLLQQILAATTRIEAKQDFLIGALAEGEQQPDLLDTGPDTRPLEPSDPK